MANDVWNYTIKIFCGVCRKIAQIGCNFAHDILKTMEIEATVNISSWGRLQLSCGVSCCGIRFSNLRRRVFAGLSRRQIQVFSE